MKNLVLLAMLVATVVTAQTWQEVTSQYSKYTIQYPSDWTVGNIFHNSTANLEMITEHTMLFNTDAKIAIAVWRSHPQLTLDQWLELMQSNLKMEDGTLKPITATQENLPAYHYKFDAQNAQAFNSQMVFFKYHDRVFRVSYLERDQGLAQEIYNHVIKTMSFKGGANNQELSPLPSTRPATRVYNCGDQYDTCQCNMDNPYPCCDNGGNCTWWAWEKACCNWGVGLPSPWRHAKYWAVDLASNGYSVSSTARAGSIACRDTGTYGHVAWVLEVSGSSVRVSEMNCCGGCNYGVREHWYDASYFTGGYIRR